MPDFDLELVCEAWSEWRLGAIERSRISLLISPAMSMDGDGSKQVLCLTTDDVLALHIYDVCLAYSFVIMPFFRVLFIRIGMYFIPLALCS